MMSSRKQKVFTTVAAFVFSLVLFSSSVLAATKDIVKDGEFQNVGFINAGEVVEGTIQGPGNWTQLNLGDAAAEAPYLHIIVKATGDTAAAQIAVSDLFTFNLADLGITLTDEYQDVVLPVEDKGITVLSWLNFMGLDGGSSVYTVKDVFLSDDDVPTLKAPAVEAAPLETAVEEAVATDNTVVPKTGSSSMVLIVSLLGMASSIIVTVGLKKYRKVEA